MKIKWTNQLSCVICFFKIWSRITGDRAQYNSQNTEMTLGLKSSYSDVGEP